MLQGPFYRLKEKLISHTGLVISFVPCYDAVGKHQFVIHASSPIMVNEREHPEEFEALAHLHLSSPPLLDWIKQQQDQSL